MILQKLVRKRKLINQKENRNMMMKKKTQMENQKILLFGKKMVQKIRNQNSRVGTLHQKVIVYKGMRLQMTKNLQHRTH